MFARNCPPPPFRLQIWTLPLGLSQIHVPPPQNQAGQISHFIVNKYTNISTRGGGVASVSVHTQTAMPSGAATFGQNAFNIS